MFEFLFFVTAVYMGYVAYEAYQAVDRAEKGEPVFREPPPKKDPKPTPTVAVAAPSTERAEAAPSKVTVPEKTAAPAPKKPVKPAAEKAKTPTKTAATKASSSEKKSLSDNLKNPETGEVTAVPVNYRFAKKWIKDALVSEGLLDRVYKPNELDDATSKKVKDAIDQMRSIKKYQA